MSTYHEPLALITVSSISIGIAVIVAIFIAADIVYRRGWRSMMAIMIPVYIINALYLWPITLWTYLKYGRPTAPNTEHTAEDHNAVKDEQGDTGETDGMHERGNGNANSHQHHEHHTKQRPMFATVTIGVCHCGAGCVLGDVVGEWLVWGTGAAIGSPARMLWVTYLVDFGFAFAFGVFFQYFSIAPMEGNYSPSVMYRALKADALSLLCFEVGLFGWMAIFQIAIFKWDLPETTVTYWWMMQIGMFLGHWTAVPINWWLIKKGVKAPCA